MVQLVSSGGMLWLVSLVTYDSDSEFLFPLCHWECEARSLWLPVVPLFFIFFCFFIYYCDNENFLCYNRCNKKGRCISTPAYFYFASIAIYLSSFQTFYSYDSIRSRLSLLGNYMSAKRCRILIFPEVLHSFICFPPQCI